MITNNIFKQINKNYLWLVVEKIKTLFFYLIIFFLPFQVNKCFFTFQAIINGKLIDYFLPSFYIEDFLILSFLFFSLFSFFNHFSKKVNTFLKIVILLSLLYLSLLIYFNFLYLSSLPTILKLIREWEFFLFFIVLGLQHKDFFNWLKIFTVIAFSSGIVSIILIGEFCVQHSLNFQLLGEWSFNQYTANIPSFFIWGQKILRVKGTFPHANVAAFYLSFFSMIPLYLGLIKKQKLFLLIFFENLIGLFVTFSKIGYLLFFFNMLLFLLYFYLVRIKKDVQNFLKHRSFLGILILGLILITAFIPLFLYRFFSLFGTDSLSLERRIFLISEAETMIRDHFFTGVGLNRFLLNLNFQKTSFPEFFFQPVHNFFLLFLSEKGFLLFLIFLVFPLILFFRQLQLFYIEKYPFFRFWLILFFLNFFFASFFDHYFYSLYQGNLWFFLLLSLSLI